MYHSVESGSGYEGFFILLWHSQHALYLKTCPLQSSRKHNGIPKEEEKAEMKQAGQRLRKLILAEETREKEALREGEEVTYEAGAF